MGVTGGGRGTNQHAVRGRSIEQDRRAAAGRPDTAALRQQAALSEPSERACRCGSTMNPAGCPDCLDLAYTKHPGVDQVEAAVLSAWRPDWHPGDPRWLTEDLPTVPASARQMIERSGENLDVLFEKIAAVQLADMGDDDVRSGAVTGAALIRMAEVDHPALDRLLAPDAGDHVSFTTRTDTGQAAFGSASEAILFACRRHDEGAPFVYVSAHTESASRTVAAADSARGLRWVAPPSAYPDGAESPGELVAAVEATRPLWSKASPAVRARMEQRLAGAHSAA